MANATRIGIIGDFNPGNITHIATDRAIQDAAKALGKQFESVWIPTNQSSGLDRFDALFCSPGSPYKSLDGALNCIRYARENNVPFIGTCGGFQHMVLEYARNVLGISDAAHAETDPYASRLFITPLSCSLVGQTMEVNLKSGSKAAAMYPGASSTEAYYCNFGLNPIYQAQLEEAGLKVSATDRDGEVRIMELPSHRFFLGTLFVPQARSDNGKAHPLILAFCRAALSELPE
jgi:CTP synthase (UTP-ammonia lyase)